VAKYGSVKTSLGHGNFLSDICNFMILTLPTMNFNFEFDPTFSQTAQVSLSSSTHPGRRSYTFLSNEKLTHTSNVQGLKGHQQPGHKGFSNVTNSLARECLS
jgi:hypothetical protein